MAFNRRAPAQFLNEIRRGAYRRAKKLNRTTIVLEVTGDRAFRKGGSDLNEFLVHRDFGPTFGAHQGCGGTCKVFRVAGNVEADDITTEQTFQNLLPPGKDGENIIPRERSCLLYTSPSPRDGLLSRMPSSA